MERVKGIEPSYAAWEAAVLPLNYTRVGPMAGEEGAFMAFLACLGKSGEREKWFLGNLQMYKYSRVICC